MSYLEGTSLDPLMLVAIGMLVVLCGILVFRLHAFVALFLGALVVGWMTPAENIRSYAAANKMTPEQTEQLVAQPVGERLSEGFGGTCAKIGLLIALASILGKALLESGGAERIVRTMLRVLGEDHAGLALLCCGFILGIPIYIVPVFYLLIPLGKTLGTRYPHNYLLYVLAIVAGASITHSLMPPNPGPVFVASKLNVEIGTMMLGGFLVGVFTTIIAYFYALWANRRWLIPVRETADVSLAQLKALSAKDDGDLPPFWLAILPILVPIALIAAPPIQKLIYLLRGLGAPRPADPFTRIVTNLGHYNLALTLGAAIAIAILISRKITDKKKLAATVETSLAGAGVIILITAAGGAFGEILQQTGIGPRLQALASGRVAVLPLAFLVTMLLRTAQGSANVAMFAAVGIFKGFVDPATLGFHPVYLALAIGCGSKPFSWMNDSGFWLIGKISGFTEVETLRSFSIVLLILGIMGLAMTMVCAKFFPLI